MSTPTIIVSQQDLTQAQIDLRAKLGREPTTSELFTAASGQPVSQEQIESGQVSAMSPTSTYVSPPPSSAPTPAAIVSQPLPRATPSVSPTLTPEPLANPITDVLVEQQKSYEAGRAASAKAEASLNVAKQQLSEAYSSPGKYEALSVAELQNIANVEQAKINYFNQQLFQYREQLDAALLQYKRYGGLTDVGFARLETPEFASAYASSLKARGVSATTIEQSGLPEQVKTQFASLGGLTGAGEAQPAKLERMREEREGGLTEAGRIEIPARLAEIAKEEYARTGGLTEYGKRLYGTPEMIKVQEEAEVERGRDIARSTLLSGDTTIIVRSERELSGARMVLSDLQLQQQRELDAQIEAQRVRERGGGLTQYGEARVSSKEYVESVVNPALQAQAKDIQRSREADVTQFYQRRIDLLKEAGYTVTPIEGGGFSYYKEGVTPAPRNVYEAAQASFVAGKPFPRTPPKEGIVVTETPEKSLKEKYLELAMGNRVPRNLAESIDIVNAEVIASGIGFGESVGRFALGVGYYVGSRGIREPLVERETSIWVPSGTGAVLSEASRRLGGGAEVSVGPLTFAGSRDVAFARKYPVTASLDVALEVATVAPAAVGVVRKIKSIFGFGGAGAAESFAGERVGFRPRTLAPEERLSVKTSKSLPRLSDKYMQAADEVDAELTKIAKTGEPEDFLRAVKSIDQKIYEKITTPKFSEPSGAGVELRSRGGIQIAKVEEKLEEPTVKTEAIPKLSRISIAKISGVALAKELSELKPITVFTQTSQQVQSIKQIFRQRQKVSEVYQMRPITETSLVDRIQTSLEKSTKTQQARRTRTVIAQVPQQFQESTIQQIQEPKQTPIQTLKQIPIQKAIQTPILAPIQASFQAPKQIPKQLAKLTPIQITTQIPEQTPIQTPFQTTKQAAKQATKQTPIQATAQIPVSISKIIQITTQKPPERKFKPPSDRTKDVRRRFGAGRYARREVTHPIATAEQALSAPYPFNDRGIGRRRKRR